MHTRRWILAGTAWLLTLALTTGVAAQSSSPYDVLTYRLAVTIDFSESPGPDSPYRPYFSVLNTLEAEATLHLVNVSDLPQEEISLILHRLMQASAVEASGKALAFEQTLRGLEGQENFHINHLQVRWAEPLDPDFTILRYETFCYPQVAESAVAGRRASRRRTA